MEWTDGPDGPQVIWKQTEPRRSDGVDSATMATAQPLQRKLSICEICGKSFTKSRLLRYHMNRHLNITPYECDQCEFKSCYPTSLSKHKLIHSGEKPFACQFCNYRSVRRRNLNNHVLAMHSKEKPFKCEKCDYSSVNSGHVKEHFRTKHSEGQCGRCAYKAKGPKELKAHFIIAHKGGLLCDQCDFTTTRNHKLKLHFNKHHQGIHPFPCNKCSFRSSTYQFLTTHKRTHAEGASEEMIMQAELHIQKCDKCDFQAFSLNDLQDHVTKTHRVNRRFPCALCPYAATGAAHLRTHLLTHTGERPFACPHCDYRGRTSSHMNAHLTTHSAEKPFACDECAYKGASKPLLRKHQKTMHMNRNRKGNGAMRIRTDSTRNKHSPGEKPFSCPFCSYRSKLAFHMELHLTVHSGLQPYVCEECGYRTSDQHGLDQHKTVKHGNKKPSEGAKNHYANSPTVSKMFNCRVCSFSAPASKDLKNHVLSVHNRRRLVYGERSSNDSESDGCAEEYQTPARGEGKVAIESGNKKSIAPNPKHFMKHLQEIPKLTPKILSPASAHERSPHVPLDTSSGISKKFVTGNPGVKKKDDFLNHEVFENFLVDSQGMPTLKTKIRPVSEDLAPKILPNPPMPIAMNAVAGNSGQKKKGDFLDLEIFENFLDDFS